jgi:hypothetical protein
MWNHFSDHFGDKKEMVIVDPDGVASLVLTYDDIGKGPIDSDIMFPTFLLPYFVLWIIRDLIMKCRPDDLFAVSVIVTFQVGIRDEDRNRSFLNCEEFGDI